jgi:hypothetical protein
MQGNEESRCAVVWVDCMSLRRGEEERREDGGRREIRLEELECTAVRKPHDAEPSSVVDSKERTN